MEPTLKKRKLAPKVDAALHPQPAHRSQDPQQYPVQEHVNQERHGFESFARHLQDAAILIQRQTESLSYSEVSVLLLRWEDDPTAEEDLATLEKVFQQHYRFGTQTWKIPTVPNPSVKLGVQMASFLEHARPDHLLIVVYAGHGYVSDGQLIWACNAKEDASKLKWDGIRCLFDDAQSDILLLLDTCTLPDLPISGGHGVKQAIAAGRPDKAHPGSDRTFVSHLSEALQRLSGSRPFSAYRLYEQLYSQKKQQQHTCQPPPSHGTTPHLMHPSEMPIFKQLTPGKTHDMLLGPLSPRLAQQGPQSADDSRPSREDRLFPPEALANLRFEEARILVCTTFVGDASPDMSYFHQWLRETPQSGAGIAVEGLFLGPPTMLLVSMPHSIWNVVQHDKVCCFLGYITSHNMLHLYQGLLGSSNVPPAAREADERQGPVGPQELATPQKRPILNGHKGSLSVERPEPVHDSPPTPLSAGSGKPKREFEQDSVEMQEAAEQLKALSHVRHLSNESNPSAPRQRTGLPSGLPELRQQDDNELDMNSSISSPGFSQANRSKGLRRSLPKADTRCNHCSHAPFKDSSSLRKHIAAAHTRPFPCAFSFAGCQSTFGSKNEWKRHIASQHLCLTFYRCASCPWSSSDGKGNEFNRKDLFTQHLRRMHAPFQVKRSVTKNDSKEHSDWDEHVKQMQQKCLVTRRLPPQRAACPKPECRNVFEGAGAWDEWTEHVGRHMEKGEGARLAVDDILAAWSVEEGIVEKFEDGTYRLVGGTGTGSGGNPETPSVQPATDGQRSPVSNSSRASNGGGSSVLQVKDTASALGKRTFGSDTPKSQASAEFQEDTIEVAPPVLPPASSPPRAMELPTNGVGSHLNGSAMTPPIPPPRAMEVDA